MIPFLIDTDTASDDAVALIMALRAPVIKVVAITIVAGNVPVEQGTRNALYTVDLCEQQTPVYAGADRPLTRVYASADWFHGKDGLGDHNYPAPKQLAQPMHAVDAIIQSAENNPGLVIVTLGPLTNLALAIRRDPHMVKDVSRCVVMGGNPCCEGNVTPAAEYNIWVDPEAAKIVLDSGLPIELIGWHLCRGEAVINAHEIEQILNFQTRRSHFAVECNSRAREAIRIQTGEEGISLPDPVAMGIAIDPTLVTRFSHHAVQVETSSELTRGMTVVDRLNVSGDGRNRDTWRHTTGKVSVAWEMDVARWKQQLFAALR